MHIYEIAALALFLSGSILVSVDVVRLAILGKNNSIPEILRDKVKEVK